MQTAVGGFYIPSVPHIRVRQEELRLALIVLGALQQENA